jgi:NAD(P)H-hydrate epimerase
VFRENTDTRFQMITGEYCKNKMKKRNPFSHKGNYGHALIVAGSKGKIGAAVLAGTACIRSGVGLLTLHLPACGVSVLHATLPEAMVSEDIQDDFFSMLPADLSKFNVIGIGPGIGTAPQTAEALKNLLSTYHRPVVMDADALNILAQIGMENIQLPTGSILTPHPGEFERLCGKTAEHFERMELALQKAREWNCVMVLKSKFTLIACPDGKAWFNPTGNPGMAKAGSGDVLAGMLTALLARGYDSVTAAQLGVYLHGYAGDLAAVALHEESMKAGDIIQSLPAAFQAIAS